MKSTTIWVLALVNALLLAALIGRVSQPNAAYAQQKPAARPGDFIMIPGEATGIPAAVVYLLDTTNGVLGAMVYNDSMKRLEAMPGKIDLASIFSGEIPTKPAEKDRYGRERKN